MGMRIKLLSAGSSRMQIEESFRDQKVTAMAWVAICMVPRRNLKLRDTATTGRIG